MVAEHGSARVALLYALHRVLQKLSGGRAAIVPYLLVAQPVGNPVLAQVRADAGTVVERIGPDHPQLAAFPRPADVIAQRFADGAECHVATVKGQFAGHIWIARGRYVEDEVRCVYEIIDPATGVWDYDVYVEPRLRLGRTMGRLWKAVDERLAAEGVRWSFSRINRFNVGSVKSHQRLGAVTTGRVVFVVLGPVQLDFSGGLKWPGVHVGQEGGPLLQLSPPLDGGGR
jgi:hypothetical protein